MMVFVEEWIFWFQLDIDVQVDGCLIVIEMIIVWVEGNQIKCGIFCDIFLWVCDVGGWEYQVGFEFLDVCQDGGGVLYFIWDSMFGVWIYIGWEDVFLELGNYIYIIQYEMDWQIWFFGDYDEVYWNVIGNEWVFLIDEVVVWVWLLGGIWLIDLVVYMGFFGLDGIDYEVLVDESIGEVVFWMMQLLGVYEGLIVVVGFFKGVVIELILVEKLQIWLED